MKLRGMDIDDLIILVMLADKISITEIGKRLFLTQPAISQRVAKIRQVTGICVAMKIGRHLKMTQQGMILAVSAKEALITLLRAFPDPFTYGGGDALIHYILSKRSDWAAHESHDA